MGPDLGMGEGGVSAPSPQERTDASVCPRSAAEVRPSPPVPEAAVPRAAGRGGEGAPALSGQAWRDAVKAATSALHKKQRTNRHKRPGPPIVGVRAAQKPRGEER